MNHFKSALKVLLISTLATAGSACAPGLGPKLDVKTLQVSIDGQQANSGASRIALQLRPVVDDRGGAAIATIDGRQVEAEGDLAEKTQAALASYLESNGVQLSVPDAPILGARISEWKVEVLPGFPSSRAVAKATLEVEVSNLSNQIIYRGKYSGDTAMQHPMLNQQRILDALGDAMGFAIVEILNDQKLVDRLVRTYHPIY